MRDVFDSIRNSEFFQSKKNLIILAVLILALPVGIFLITQQQIFKSRASGDLISLTGNNVTRRADGTYVMVDATRPTVTLQLTSTLDKEAPPPPVEPEPDSQAPTAPTGLTATCPAPGTTASFSWSVSTGAVRYDLYVFDTTAHEPNWQAKCGADGRVECKQVSGTTASLATTPGTSYKWFVTAVGTGNAQGDPAASTFICTRPEATWSANLLDPSLQNTTVNDPVTQKVQWFGPGTYTFSGAITSNTPKVQGNPTFASLQADEWTDAGAFSGVHSPGTPFTVPAGSKAAVILRTINANAAFANVSLTKEQEGTNLMDPSLVNSTVTQTQGAGRADPSTSQKFRIYGTVSGDGFLDVAEWTPYPNPVWQSAHQVGDPPFGISAAGNFLQVGYNVRSGSVTFSNVRFVEVTQSANLVDSDKQNTSVSDPVTQKTQEFGPGTYKLSGDITANNPVVQGNPTHASIQADEWNQAGTSFIGVHDPGSTFTVPSGNKIVVILRAINANATFANVSLQKQQ